MRYKINTKKLQIFQQNGSFMEYLISYILYLISPKKHSFCCKNGCSDYDLSAFLVREKVPIASRTMAPKQAVMTL